MQRTNPPSCAVAFPRVLKNATDNERATDKATAITSNARKPASLQELRAQLKAQLVRNYGGDCESEKQAELRTSESATALPDERGARGAEVVTPKAELTALVNQVADYSGFTAEQRQEALEIALGDPTAAVECFRELAARMIHKRGGLK